MESDEAEKRTFLLPVARSPFVVIFAAAAAWWGQHQETSGLERGQSMGRAEAQNLMEARTREVTTLRADVQKDIETLRGDVHRDLDDVKDRLGRLEARNEH